MDEQDQPGFYRPFDNNDFRFDRCFLCGRDFIDVQKTDEHVFPKWLLHHFGLFNETLTLLNGTTIPYRLLTIPSCIDCNGVHLAQVEDKFKQLLSRGFKDLKDADEQIIFQWTAKILYGTMYKELSLPLDRRNRDVGNIMNPDTLERFRTLHMLLQSARIPTEFRVPKPWSIFVFNYEDNDFHYINDILHQCFSVKLGKVGVTVVFEDAGAVGLNMRWMHKLRMFQLNQFQFMEISALLFYGKRLMTNTISYLTAYSMTHKVMTIAATNRPRGREWNMQEYATFLHEMLLRDGYEGLDEYLFGEELKQGFGATWLVTKEGVPMKDIIDSHRE
jgi:hypothetical protein